MKRHKNVSQKVPAGRTLQTRDEFFEGRSNYRKPGYENKGNYRKVVVVDSNRDDELAVVKLTTSAKGQPLSNQERFKPYIETRDDRGRPIKTGRKFVPNKAGKDLPKQDVDHIKRVSLADKKNKTRNRKRLRKLKRRK